MKEGQRMKYSAGFALMAMGAVVVALLLAAVPGPGWTAVTCPPPNTTVDSDNDGFTDSQECSGITTAGTSPRSFPVCAGGDRTQCVDPNSKDLFVIFIPAATGSLLPSGYTPFASSLTYYGVTFNGLSDLGITVHQVSANQVKSDRTVMTGSTQKAVRAAESIDTNGTILGNCQWGKPGGLDGCVIYTQRIKNFIDSVCNSVNDLTTDRNQVLLAYVSHTVLHEVGHSLGGLVPSASYNASYGGYHYACGAGSIMEQCVTYSTKAGQCTFNISNRWNTTLDPSSVQLR